LTSTTGYGDNRAESRAPFDKTMPEPASSPPEAAGAAATTADPAELIREFKAEVVRQEDLLYGFALFFEGISLLYAGQESVILTYRKQIRNVIRAGRQTIEQAAAILPQAETDPAKVHLIEHMRFTPGQGHPHPKELCDRARVLVEAYDECFPGRPRADPFVEHEIVRLLNAAAAKLPAPDSLSSAGG